MCKDCSKLVKCVEESNGFTEVPVEDCNTENEEYCFNDSQCSTSFNTHCTPDYEFKCTATAFFPDPVDCRVYHICVKVAQNTFKHNVFRCNEPYAYNMKRTYCDHKLKENRCPENLPVPECSYDGQTGALENESIWFICKKDNSNHLIPELQLCPNAQFYNGTACEVYIWP